MLPEAAYPLVNGTPTLVQSPIKGDYDYNAYNNAVVAIGTGTYVDGWVNGYKILTSGCYPDVPLITAMNLAGNARKAKNQYFYGIGALDIWRLFFECQNSIQCVIDRINNPQ